MYQIDNSTAATTQPAATSAGTAGFFTDGNPATSTPATIVPAEWLNAVMMELSNVVTAAGLTLSKPTYNQVLAAIKRLGQSTIILADTGAANAYTAVNSPPLVAGTWVDGVVQQVKIAHANTGASTYAPDGLTAIPIYGLGLQPLQGGELALNGTAVLMRLTIAGVNSGNPIAVLMECAGGAQQIAPATQSQHAVQMAQVRVKLTSDTTFFVATTGNDANSGLSAGSPFLTIQGAINAIANGYDLRGFNVTVSVAAGSYTGFSVAGPFTGQAGSTFIIAGSSASITTPLNNVLVGATSGARIQVSGFTLSSASAGVSGVFCGTGSSIVLGAGMVFGAMVNGNHIISSDNGQVFPQANYTISGGAQAHFNTNRAASITLNGITITVTGTPAWGSSFAAISNLGLLYMSANTITGSATGVRYNVTSGGLINTFGGGASYFPGSAAGVTATQGQYI